jgi:hypothetical protein
VKVRKPGRHLLAAAVALWGAACLHDPQVVHLRRDAVPWMLGQPFEVSLGASGPETRVLRFDLPEASGLRLRCTGGDGAELLVYAAPAAALSQGPCAPRRLERLEAGTYFLVLRAPGPMQVSVRVDAE